jgi:hypothetical protein
MKKQSVNTMMRKTLLVSALVVMGLFAAQSKAVANNNLNKADSVKTEKAAIKYIGSTGEYLYFSVDYNNAEGKNFSVSIKDNTEDVLFYDTFNNKTFHKVFKLPKDLDVSALSFAVKGGKENYAESFNVNISSKMVTDVTVSRN